jgi:hypothetical protein
MLVKGEELAEAPQVPLGHQAEIPEERLGVRERSLVPLGCGAVPAEGARGEVFHVRPDVLDLDAARVPEALASPGTARQKDECRSPDAEDPRSPPPTFETPGSNQ